MSSSSSGSRDEIAIKLDNVRKEFQIYEKPHHRLLQSLFQGRRKFYRDFTALSNISFDIHKGESVGIIGRNGAGKSTLLQIISGTMTQSAGEIEINGRIAALLELGAGFNPEFTGSENIYLNGSILGLSHDDMESKYDDIVAFADIGEFIDQPVKTYSSGMYVRLAFSVVMHIEPEILIVDEALAVGDAFFQAKCMLAMKRLMNQGVTLLFVSHDASAVKALCDRAILLDKGHIQAIGDTNTIVEIYFEQKVSELHSAAVLPEAVEGTTDSVDKSEASMPALAPEVVRQFQEKAGYQRIKRGKAEFLNVEIRNDRDSVITMCEFGETVKLVMYVKMLENISHIAFAYHVRDKNGFDIVYSDTSIEELSIVNANAGEVHLLEWTFDVNLKEGEYVVAAMSSIPIDLLIGDVEVCDFIPIAAQLNVTRGQSFPMYGVVYWKNLLTHQIISMESDLR